MILKFESPSGRGRSQVKIYVLLEIEPQGDPLRRLAHEWHYRAAIQKKVTLVF